MLQCYFHTGYNYRPTVQEDGGDIVFVVSQHKMLK